LLGLHALHPFALSILPIGLQFWTVIPVTENSTNFYIGREKKKREERSEAPKPNEAVTKFDGNLYSMRH